MVTENGMVMMTLGEYHSLNATKNKVKEIEKSNETEISRRMSYGKSDY